MTKTESFQDDLEVANQSLKRRGLARIKASEDGLQKVDQARKRKGWAKSAEVWYGLALTSESTLKRFWRQSRICQDSFVSICSAVGIEDWESIVDWSG